MTADRHSLILAAERLCSLRDATIDARYSLQGMALDDAERHLHNAEMFVESAWQAVEKAILTHD